MPLVKRTAITGGVAEGKSTVLGYLADAGYAVESSDRIAREIFQGAEMQESISRLLRIPPPVDPSTLRERMADSAIRRAVNSLAHPRIFEALRACQADFIEVPLLIETCLQGEFGRVWVVTCGIDEQRRRLHSRLGDEAAILAFLRMQLTSRAKIPFADRVIRTNREESAVQRCVTDAAQRDLG
jgi:dephospho-CoA kinase